MTKVQLKRAISELEGVSQAIGRLPEDSTNEELFVLRASLVEKINTQIDVMYQGADENESFEPEPPYPAPYGSEWFYCPKCKKHSLSAGDGCNSCGYGYIDEDEPLPTDDEIIAAQNEWLAEQAERAEFRHSE